MKPIKKASHAEVHWMLTSQNAGNQANQRLKEWLGDDIAAMFAPLQMANNQYVWYVEEKDEWCPVSAADPNHKYIINNALNSLTQKVKNTLSFDSKMAETLLTVPNLDYIFYKIASGKVSLLLTGWACQNKRTAEGFFIAKHMEMVKMEKVAIAFTVAGEPQPFRAFINMINGEKLFTGEKGFFEFNNKLEVGQEFSVQDVESGFIFNVIVESGKNIYELEVPVTVEPVTPPPAPVAEDDTANKSIVITVVSRRNGRLLPNYQIVTILPDSSPLNLMSDFTGKVYLSPLPQGTNIRVLDMAKPENEQTYVIEKGANELLFEVDPDPDVRITVLDSEGKPMAGAFLSLQQGVNNKSLQLDNFGSCFVYEDDFVCGPPVTCSLHWNNRNFPQIVFAFDMGEKEYVLQEKAPESRAARIIGQIALLAGTLIVAIVSSYFFFDNI